jgi:hypothetical protein
MLWVVSHSLVVILAGLLEGAHAFPNQAAQVQGLAVSRRVSEPALELRDVLFLGPPGVGKSFLVQAVGYQAIKSGFSVLYRSIFDVVRDVIELSVLDVIAQTTRGQPILSMCLDWQAAEGEDRAAGCWRMVRKLPLVALISPQFVRRRDDKAVNPQDVRLEQITALAEVPLADCDARQCSLPQSQVLRRAVWTKQLKGKTLVRKLVLWQTHKEIPLLAGAEPDWPAYVLASTDYSPDRAEPLQRDLRVSSSRTQIDRLWDELEKEKIVKGWMLNSSGGAA